VCYNYGIVIQEVPLETSVGNIDRRVAERDSCNLHIDILCFTIYHFCSRTFTSSLSLSLSSTDHFFSRIHSSILSRPTTIHPLSFGLYRIPSVWLTVSDQCRITPFPPKKKQRRRRRKEFFLLSTYVWVGFDTTDWLSGIFIWWSCKNHHDHPPSNQRGSPRRRSLKCQVCDWLVVKGYIHTNITEWWTAPLIDVTLRDEKQPMAIATICCQRMNDLPFRCSSSILTVLSFFFKTLNHRWVLTHTLLYCLTLKKWGKKLLCSGNHLEGRNHIYGHSTAKMYLYRNEIIIHTRISNKKSTLSEDQQLRLS